MSTKATLFEYQKYPYQKADSDSFREGMLYLTEKTIGLLETLNQSKPFMECSLKTIRPLNYVGVVRIGDLSIEIFPKLFKDDKYREHRTTIAGNLLKMLSYTGKVPIKEMSYADLDLEKYDLFEIFIHIFAKNLLHTIKSTLKREYIKKSDDIHVIKGRIDFKKYHNPCRMHIIPCHYHEYSIDNSLNRTLKFTCHLMARSVSDFSTAKTLRTIVDLLDQVTLTPVSIADIEKITFTRLNQIFKPYIEMCKIFISHSTLTLQASNVESFTMLLPMEKLFEEFIAEVLQENPSYFFGTQVPIRAQPIIGKLAKDENNKELFRLKPDIIIGSPKIRAIIDTKYKALDPFDSNLGVSQSDVYQMYAYATKTNTDRCMLLYPEVLLEQKKDLVLSIPGSEGMRREVFLLIRAIRLSYNMNTDEEWAKFRDELRTIVQPLLEGTEMMNQSIRSEASVI